MDQTLSPYVHSLLAIQGLLRFYGTRIETEIWYPIVERVINITDRTPLERPTLRWEDNIKMDQKVGWGGMDWTDLAQDKESWRALVNAVMNLRVP
jgi:hypothetical protein